MECCHHTHTRPRLIIGWRACGRPAPALIAATAFCSLAAEAVREPACSQTRAARHAAIRMRPPGRRLKIPAWVFCMSWCPDFEFRGGIRRRPGREELTATAAGVLELVGPAAALKESVEKVLPATGCLSKESSSEILVCGSRLRSAPPAAASTATTGIRTPIACCFWSLLAFGASVAALELVGLSKSMMMHPMPPADMP